MANTIIQCDAPEGLTLLLKLYAVNGDTILNGVSGDTLTERTNNKGRYTATVTQALVGVHEVRVTTVADQTLAVYITEPLVDDTSTYKCIDVISSSTTGVTVFPIVERSTADDNDITFAWPVLGATITSTVSVDNASYTATTGAIAFLRTEGSRHLYTLAFNVADRPVEEGTARYTLADGTYNKYLTLRVEGVDQAGVREAVGLAAANLDSQLNSLNNRSSLEAF